VCGLKECSEGTWVEAGCEWGEREWWEECDRELCEDDKVLWGDDCREWVGAVGDGGPVPRSDDDDGPTA
jgi:hypothetical protein